LFNGIIYYYTVNQEEKIRKEETTKLRKSVTSIPIFCYRKDLSVLNPSETKNLIPDSSKKSRTSVRCVNLIAVFSGAIK
jgi:hypothetical protein